MISESLVVWKIAPAQFQAFSQLMSVDQISVMYQRHRSLDVPDHQRLRVDPAGISGGRITDMTHRDLSFPKLLEIFLVKDIGNQTHILMTLNHTVTIHRDTAALLSSVL